MTFKAWSDALRPTIKGAKGAGPWARVTFLRFWGGTQKRSAFLRFWSSRPKTQKHLVPAIGLLLVETSVMRFCVFAFLRFCVFDTGPEGPELEGQHKGIQQVCALSTPKEKTPTAALRAAKGSHKDRPKIKK